ncbi:mas-related G-protein coupled receptor member A8-like [Molothrus ater]|uniref:mas-related G-protein coupled receptor member A8-like n=1 Tax=Molothrus ater TaxID=84834 RepID=UPI001748E375|nr:mas-related G-protein coupled receptor member A8-like [Molothrus ater]XP_036239621.1 mas-related G-protein coupled receptor member A8-like [Molothrus ater]
MEVTTVSPSPASPTEGDDLCETDVTTVAIHSVTLLICLSGLAGNGAVLWFTGSRWLSRKRTNRYILILTFLDFLFLLFLVPFTLLFLLEVVSCSIIMPLWFVTLLFEVPLVSYNLWLYTLTFISIKRCRSIHCPLWHCCHHPQQLLKVMHWGLLGIFFMAFITIFATMISLCGIQRSKHCWMSLFSMYAFNLLFCAPFVFISSIILFIKVKSGSDQQQRNKLNIVICIIVLFTLPRSLCNLVQQFGYAALPSPVSFLLNCIHTSINPIICFLVGRCWRPCSMGSLWLSLQRVFEETEENTAHSHDPAMDTVL